MSNRIARQTVLLNPSCVKIIPNDRMLHGHNRELRFHTASADYGLAAFRRDARNNRRLSNDS